MTAAEYLEEADRLERIYIDLAAGAIASYSINSRTFTKQSLPALLDVINYLRKRAAQVSGGNVTFAVNGGW